MDLRQPDQVGHIPAHSSAEGRAHQRPETRPMPRSKRTVWAFFHAGQRVKCPGTRTISGGRYTVACHREIIARVGPETMVAVRVCGPREPGDPGAPGPSAFLICPRCDTALEVAMDFNWRTAMAQAAKAEAQVA